MARSNFLIATTKGVLRVFSWWTKKSAGDPIACIIRLAHIQMGLIELGLVEQQTMGSITKREKGS